MDRKLNVIFKGATVAEFTFDYDTDNNVTIHIVLNKIVYLDEMDGMELPPAVYPMLLFEQKVDQQHFSSAEEMKQYDTDLYLQLTQQYKLSISGEVEYSYEQPYECRYVMGDPANNLAGIATVICDMEQDIKELQFISARRTKDDLTIATVAMEANIPFITRIFESHMIGDASHYSKVAL